MVREPILLVRPPINIERNAPFFLPLGLLCNAAVVRDAGFDVAIVDYEFLVRSEKLAPPDPLSWLPDLCDPLLERAPAIIGLTALADTLPTCLLMGRYMKARRPDIPVVIGGPGTFGMLPMIGDRHANCFDYLCINEGELALLELVERAARSEKLPNVPGLWSPRHCDIAPTARSFARIDELPMPAYDLLPINEYLELATPRIFDLYLGTGCTYSCKFCVTSTFWNRIFRSKSPATVLAELDYLFENFGITTVNFLHDNFANRKDYLQSFIDYFIEHNHRYEWGCAVRPDNVSRTQLEQMRRAGCKMIFCGTDSGAPKILKSMAKMTKLDRSYRFFENCAAANITFETNAIIGFPDESDGDLEETLGLVFDAVAYGATNSDVSVLQPLPGAEVTQDNIDSLTWVGQALVGAFLPAEALDLARAEPRLFTGFSFIRRGNRAFGWYEHLTQQVRFFTRHYFRTLYFLKQRCGISYVDIFERMAASEQLADLGRAFATIFNELSIPEDDRELAVAILATETAAEKVKGLDVQREIANIYARAEADADSQAHALVTVSHPVHVLFEGLPASLEIDVAKRATTYLIYRSLDDQLVTLRLAQWQLRLWSDLSASSGRADTGSEIAEELHATGVARAAAERAVGRAAALFHDILWGRAATVGAD